MKQTNFIQLLNESLFTEDFQNRPTRISSLQEGPHQMVADLIKNNSGHNPLPVEIIFKILYFKLQT